MKTVEVLKIGSVMPVLPIKGRTYDTSQFKCQTIMVVSDGGDLYDHYVSILRKACESEYKLLKTEKGIVGTSAVIRISNQPNIKGTSYTDPVVGSSYSLEFRSSIFVQLSTTSFLTRLTTHLMVSFVKC